MNINVLLWYNEEGVANLPVNKEDIDDANLFSISKEQCDIGTATKVAEHLSFQGKVRESESGKSYICFKDALPEKANAVTVTIS